MKAYRSLSGEMTVLGFAAGVLLSMPAAAQSAQPGAESGKWQFSATIYGWFPAIKGTVNFPDDKGSTDLDIPFNKIFDHLKMTFMGTVDAHNGRWGVFTDALYMDVGGVKSQTRDLPIGNVRIPATATADLSIDLKTWVWTVAGEYRVASDPAWTVDLLAGGRMLYIKPTLGYSITGDLGPIDIPGRDGSKAITETLWDGIVGVKGQYTFAGSREWFLPFYLDVGTGQTKLTWQIAGGIGYRYSWGSVVALYRYLDWDNNSGKPLADINMGGPMLGVILHW
jgi:hypothetical protein